jgi:hypothetical protein
LGVLLNADVAFEIRTTPMPNWSPAEDVQSLTQKLSAVGVSNHVFQRFRPESTLDLSLAAN